MRLADKGFTLIEFAAVLMIGGTLFIGGTLLGDFHLDPANDSARVEIDGETLEVARFDAVDLEASSGIISTATVSFTDENGNSYSAVNGGVTMTFGSYGR